MGANLFDLLKQVLTLIPEFLLNFANFIFHPVNFLKDKLKNIKEEYDTSDEENKADKILNDAFLFLILSFSFSALLVIPDLPNDMNIWKPVKVIALMIIIIIIEAAIVHFTFKWLKGNMGLKQFVVYYCYAIGAFMMLCSILWPILLQGGYILLGKNGFQEVLGLLVYMNIITPAELPGLSLYLNVFAPIYLAVSIITLFYLIVIWPVNNFLILGKLNSINKKTELFKALSLVSIGNILLVCFSASIFTAYFKL